MAYANMQLKILLPFGILREVDGVRRIVAETRTGAFGLWPNRLDCVAALAPGILTLAAEDGAEEYLAVDEGVLVKSGREVLVSVRNAIGGADLAGLHQAVEQQFLTATEAEQDLRNALAKLEVNFVRRFASLKQSR